MLLSKHLTKDSLKIVSIYDVLEETRLLSSVMSLHLSSNKDKTFTDILSFYFFFIL